MPSSRTDTDKLFENVDTNNGFGTLVPIKLDYEIDGKRVTDYIQVDKNEVYMDYADIAAMVNEEGHEIDET